VNTTFKFTVFFLFAVYLASAGLLRVYADDNNPSQKVGIEEKIGQTIPLDLTFNDEKGQPVQLKSLITKPTILTLVYYECTGLCSPMMNGLSQAVDKMDLEPGKDFNIVTISFDPHENYVMAADKKKNYLDYMRKVIPPSSWRFLTGDSINISKITEATGFRYEKRTDKDYLHATALIVLSPQGKIARYLYGTQFLPSDLKLAINEASEGKTGPSISKLVSLCFSYDPQGRRYVLNITRVAGSGVVFLLFVFLTYLAVKKKKNKAKEKVDD
jgi:protein SCO1/2